MEKSNLGHAIEVLPDMNRLQLNHRNKPSPHEGNGDNFNFVNGTPSPANHGGGSGDCKEFFMQIMKRKTNIYSTKPVALKSPWTFWIDRTHNGMNVKEFEQNLHRISTVYSVHEFWRVICNIPLPSHLGCRSSLHMTRDIRRPIWEESYNSKGGTFRLKIPKRDSDKVWRELLMATAADHWGDFIHEQDEICGISISVREREDIVLLWNKTAALHSSARVFELVRLLLPDTPFTGEFYKAHVSHHAFEKTLAAAAATSDEGLLGLYKQSEPTPEPDCGDQLNSSYESL